MRFINTLCWCSSIVFLGLSVENLLATYVPPNGEQFRRIQMIIFGIGFGLSVLLALNTRHDKTESRRHWQTSFIILTIFIALLIFFGILFIG
jgi:hypothetical protein